MASPINSNPALPFPSHLVTQKKWFNVAKIVGVVFMAATVALAITVILASQGLAGTLPWTHAAIPAGCLAPIAVVLLILGSYKVRRITSLEENLTKLNNFLTLNSKTVYVGLTDTDELKLELAAKRFVPEPMSYDMQFFEAPGVYGYVVMREDGKVCYAPIQNAHNILSQLGYKTYTDPALQQARSHREQQKLRDLYAKFGDHFNELQLTSDNPLCRDLKEKEFRMLQLNTTPIQYALVARFNCLECTSLLTQSEALDLTITLEKQEWKQK